MNPVPEPPRFLRRLRWPLTVAFVTVLAALVVLAIRSDPGPLDADGGWLSGFVLAFAILGLSSWMAPPPGPTSPDPRM